MFLAPRGIKAAVFWYNSADVLILKDLTSEKHLEIQMEKKSEKSKIQPARRPSADDWKPCLHLHPACMCSLNLTVTAKLQYGKGQKGVQTLQMKGSVTLQRPRSGLIINTVPRRVLHSPSQVCTERINVQTCRKRRGQRGLVKSNHLRYGSTKVV